MPSGEASEGGGVDRATIEGYLDFLSVRRRKDGSLRIDRWYADDNPDTTAGMVQVWYDDSTDYSYWCKRSALALRFKYALACSLRNIGYGIWDIGRRMMWSPPAGSEDNHD